MTINFDRVNPNADNAELCSFINRTIDMLNYAINNIDEKNLTKDFAEKLERVTKK